MTEEQAIKITRTNKLLDVITNVVLSVIFDNVPNYKIGVWEETGKTGVLQFVMGRWIWSWLNTINTNYSCIHIILLYLHKHYPEKLTYSYFRVNEAKFIKLFTEYLNSAGQILFTPGSEEFTKMFFKAQWSWNQGIISSISSILTLSKHQTIETTRYIFSFYRGDPDDMEKGVDIKTLTGSTHDGFGIQHKNVKNTLIAPDSNGLYDFNLKFKESYREHVDFMVINDGQYVYVFKNTKIPYDPQCCEINGRFRIHKSLLIKKLKVENTNVTYKLMDINRYCSDNHIVFHLISEEGKTNKIEEIVDNGERAVVFTLADGNDEKLYDMLSSFYENLIK